MNQPPPIVKQKTPPTQTENTSQPTPLITMWQQSREAIADATIPVLAGLKTLWLLLLTPVNFFNAQLQGTRAASSLRTPFDPFWRAITAAARNPLEPAQLLLFAILTKVLVEQDLQTSTETGVEAGVQAGIEAANAQPTAGLTDGMLESVNKLIEDGIKTGVEFANIDEIRTTISDTEVQIAATEVGEQISQVASSQFGSLQGLVDSAVERGTEIVDVDSMLAVPSAELAKVQKMVEAGIEAGVEAGIEVNTAINQSQGLLTTLVGGALQSLISALFDLISILFVVALFAYLFRLFMGRTISAAQSYIFWLYLEGLNLFSVAAYFALLHFWPAPLLRIQEGLTRLLQGIFESQWVASFFASPAVNSLGLAPNIAAFQFLESGVHTLFWLYLLPAIVLPKVFPQLSARRVLIMTILGRLSLLLIFALVIFGLVTLIASLGLLIS